MQAKIHTYPVLCDALQPDYFSDIRLSKDIDEVTCPKCMYYYFHPEAKRLENEYQAGRL